MVFSRFRILLAFLLVAVAPSRAQEWNSCKTFFTKINDSFDCIGALLTKEPHLTFSSMPPGNGVALGGVFEQNTHYVSPFELGGRTVVLDSDGKLQEPDSTRGSLWSADGRIAAVFSTNGSWVTTGMLTLMPKGYTPGHNDNQGECNRLGPLCTKKVFGIHFEATHRSLQTISFYGIGPRSPETKYVFHQNDTYGSIRAAVPLTDWLIIESSFQYRQSDLPPTSDFNSVSANFTDATAPGLTTQPGYAHPYIALRTAPIAHLSPYSNDKDENRIGPLMKPDILFTLRNAAEYHWYAAQGDPASSFQQFVLDSDENIQIATFVRRWVKVGDIGNPISRLYYRTLSRACGDDDGIDWSNTEDTVLKVHSQCRFGSIDLRTHIVASRTGSISAVPFYLQPTVGGSDIDSRPSLRAFPHYRFRAPDALFVQTDYSLPIDVTLPFRTRSGPIILPLGLLVFYDAGTVGPTFSSLSFAHLRQDAGIGVTVSLMGNVVAQGYLAGGAGHVPSLGYNFTKVF
jgi:hypothetical protein